MLAQLVRGAISRNRFVGFLILLITLLGVIAFTRLGQLEDPEFTIRTAIVMTGYPGADAERVEQQVTEPLEKKIQQLGELESIESLSRNGTSIIYVEVKEQYGGQQLRQIWDELNKKVITARAQLPDSVRGPRVNDDYGDVYSMLLSVEGADYSYAELNDIADHLQQRLLRVDDVAKVDLFGDQGERVFIETSRSKIAELGLTPALVVNALNKQNVVAPSGFTEMGSRRLRINTTGTFESVEELARLNIRSPVTGELVQLRDFAQVRRGYANPPDASLRHQGESALALGVVPAEGANVVDLTERVQAELDRIEAKMPVGIEFGSIALQSEEIEKAVGEFLINLVTAVAIVLAVLMISLGLRTGFVVGLGVPLTILGTFVGMYMMGFELHRVSLGALVIVLGMIVDNAIVISELMQVKMQHGTQRLKAAAESVQETAWPLLAATAIAVLAFAPIALTNTATGEFTRSLFWVVAISLAISWLLAIVGTPLMNYWLLDSKSGLGNPEDRAFYQWVHRLISATLRRPWILTSSAILIVAASAVAFSFVPQTFFPPAERSQFMVDYWLPEGSRIEQTSEDMARIEQRLMAMESVTDVTAFIGEGAPRFYLPMIPRTPNPAFGQILVNVETKEDVDPVMAKVRAHLKDGYPEAEPRVRPMQLGEPVRFPLQLRVTGPEREELMDTAGKLQAVMAEHPGVTNLRHNWRQTQPRVTIDVDQDRARRAGITTNSINQALNTAFAGQGVGVFREDDERIPIVWRFPLPERTDPSELETMVVWPESGGKPVPLTQVADIKLDWERPVIWRHNRERAITLQADLAKGYTASEVRAALAPKIQKLSLPSGYDAQWDGQVHQSNEARAGVLKPVPVILGLMVLVLMAQFNSFRRTLLVMLMVPLGLVGVSVGLLLFQQPFGFMALLGTMSLSGMIIRNAVVMVQKMDMALAESGTLEAIGEAATSRVRPILLTAATTMLGMLPLAVSGPFWAPMALAIMFGLAFAAILTILVLPAGYVRLLGIRPGK
ncbi:efflux RND transporter permease subunit [Halomonadaceae bacterium KBTZ08]